MRISDWSSDVCSSDLVAAGDERHLLHRRAAGGLLGVGGLALDVDVVDERAQIGRRRADDADIAIGLFADLARGARRGIGRIALRSEEHTSELQSLMRISNAVFCLKKKT